MGAFTARGAESKELYCAYTGLRSKSSSMKQVLVFSAVVSLALGAPQYLAENKKLSGKLKDEGCHTEYVTVWEDIETEEVNKVICETEFKEECFTEYEEDVEPQEEELGVNVDYANEPSDETTQRPEDDSTIKTINTEDMSSEEMPAENSSDK